MPIFTYKAVDSSGAVRTGRLEAGERKAALHALHGKGLRPLQLQAATERSTSRGQSSPQKQAGAVLGGKSNPGTRTAPRRESVGLAFLQRLHDLHAGGMPLGDAVKLLRNRLSQPQQRDLAQRLWSELSEGRSLASAMGTLPNYFSEATRHVVEAGETTGKLAPILERVTGHLEEKAAIRAKLAASLAYPVFIAIVALVVVALFVFFLLPNFQSMISSLGGEMSWSAKLLIGLAESLFVFGPWVIGLVIFVPLLLRQLRKSPVVQLKTDIFFLRIPVMGKLLREAELFQLTSLMATLLASGINITEALRLSEKVLFNLDLKNRFNLIRREVNEGAAFASAARRHKFYPDLTLDILAVGENTGSIVHSMEQITKSLRDGLTSQIQTFTAILTTGALMGAFMLVALVAIGILTSIFQVSQALNF